jgi:hypothetical protein
MDSINDTSAQLIKVITDDLLARVKQQVQKAVTDNVTVALSRLDIPTLVREHISNVLNSSAKTYNFPERSIKGSSVNPDGLYIKAEQIAAGVIRNFESTGIQDKSSETQVTIMDNATVFENQLVANDLHIAGSAVIDGDLLLKGTLNNTSQLFKELEERSAQTMRAELRDGMYAEFSNLVFDKIKHEGLDATVFKYAGRPFVSENSLASTILNSNLQKVGALKELQVIGETLLDETLYVSNNRVGVNTINPESALDIWDQEVEIQVGKIEQNTAFISTPRNQRLIFGSNKNYNLVCNPDGSVSVSMLHLNGVRHTSSAVTPADDSPKGTIVWNSNPSIGAPIGYVSLGGARWAQFGKITT